MFFFDLNEESEFIAYVCKKFQVDCPQWIYGNFGMLILFFNIYINFCPYLFSSAKCHAEIARSAKCHAEIALGFCYFTYYACDMSYNGMNSNRQINY